MKNKTKLSKRIVAFFVFMIFTFNSFASVVSDNDGSAFITKAEFDALKSNFQAQIDTYNTNIDSKIDEAIASYLKGISLTSDIDCVLMIPAFSYPVSIRATDSNAIQENASTGTLYYSPKYRGRR